MEDPSQPGGLKSQVRFVKAPGNWFFTPYMLIWDEDTVREYACSVGSGSCDPKFYLTENQEKGVELAFRQQSLSHYGALSALASTIGSSYLAVRNYSCTLYNRVRRMRKTARAIQVDAPYARKLPNREQSLLTKRSSKKTKQPRKISKPVKKVKVTSEESATKEAASTGKIGVSEAGLSAVSSSATSEAPKSAFKFYRPWL